jgi:hypothetical protein
MRLNASYARECTGANVKAHLCICSCVLCDHEQICIGLECRAYEQRLMCERLDQQSAKESVNPCSALNLEFRYACMQIRENYGVNERGEVSLCPP